MIRTISVAVAGCSALALIGCGGGGGGSSATSAPVKVTVRWGERSRALNAPSSALSMVLELKGALAGGGDLKLVANRHSDPAAYEETYTSTESAVAGARDMTARFYARNDGSGDLVGTASGVAVLKSDGSGVPSIATEGRITAVTVGNETLVAGEKRDLAVTLFDSSVTGGQIAVSPGSIRYHVVTGTDSLRISEGQPEGVKAGVATVTATVDGVTSQPATVTILSKPIIHVNLRANEILYDPVSKKIFASVPGSVIGRGNTVTVIDPATGQIIRSVPVGSEPNRMAVSDDGSMLYVGLDGTGTVAQIDLGSFTITRTFGIYAPNVDKRRVSDLAVVPGHPERVVVAGVTGYQNPVGARLYVDGFPKGELVEWATGVGFMGEDHIPFGYTLGSTGGSSFSSLYLTDEGFIGPDQPRSLPGEGGSLRCVSIGDRIYTTWGSVMSRFALDGTFSLSTEGFKVAVAPDPARNRVYFLQGNSELAAFDLRTYAQVGAWQAPIPSTYYDQVGRLVTCGIDMVAIALNAEVLIVSTDHWRQE